VACQKINGLANPKAASHDAGLMEPLFHVYIDEAGDPGVKPKQSQGPHWSDWFVLSALVIAADREPEAVEWVNEMNRAIRRNGPTVLHYRKLSDTNRQHVCRVLADKPVRAFVVASHKNSMRNHKNKKLGRAKDWEFYNWCLRLLLERVTAWCAARCRKNGLPVHPARIVFSQRGGHDYDGLKYYLKKIEAQAISGSLTLDRNRITPGVIYERHCEVIPHSNRAGLQLADIVASAFFQSVCSQSPRHSIEPAAKLLCRMARQGRRRRPDGFGLLLLPFPHQGEIPIADRRIFELGGYRFKRK
jgi:hypothetical protein